MRSASAGFFAVGVGAGTTTGAAGSIGTVSNAPAVAGVGGSAPSPLPGWQSMLSSAAAAGGFALDEDAADAAARSRPPGPTGTRRQRSRTGLPEADRRAIRAVHVVSGSGTVTSIGVDALTVGPVGGRDRRRATVSSA